MYLGEINKLIKIVHYTLNPIGLSGIIIYKLFNNAYCCPIQQQSKNQLLTIFGYPILVIATIYFVITLVDLIIIVLKQKKYYREQYSLIALCNWLTIQIIFIFSLLLKTTPWKISTIITLKFETAHQLKTENYEYGILVIIILSTFMIYQKIYENWQGRTRSTKN